VVVNQAAHYLAKFLLSSNSNFVWVEEIPSYISAVGIFFTYCRIRLNKIIPHLKKKKEKILQLFLLLRKKKSYYSSRNRYEFGSKVIIHK